MSDTDQLRVKVIDVLKSKGCQSIRFQCADISIAGFHYGYIADLISQSCIDTIFGVTDKSAAAEYTHSSAQVAPVMRFSNLDIGYYASPEGRAQIVHESTHAIVDLTHKGKLVRRQDNETASWIAQTVYSLLSNDSVRNFGDDFTSSLAAVANEAAQGQVIVDPKAVSFIGAILQAADEKRAKDTGALPVISEMMLGIACPRPAPPPALPPMQPDPD